MSMAEAATELDTDNCVTLIMQNDVLSFEERTSVGESLPNIPVAQC